MKICIVVFNAFGFYRKARSHRGVVHLVNSKVRGLENLVMDMGVVLCSPDVR